MPKRDAYKQTSSQLRDRVPWQFLAPHFNVFGSRVACSVP